MPRQSTGQIIEHRAKDGRIYRSLRYRFAGQRRRLALGVVSRADAEAALRHLLADIERGVDPTPAPAEQTAAQQNLPTFHEYAEKWWLLNEADLAPNTQADYRWRLEKHLLGHFGELRLDRITIAEVDRYVAAKRAGALSPRSINMTVTLLAAILDQALEHEVIASNPARGKKRKAREREPHRSSLESAGEIAALLDATGDLDRKAARDRRHIERRVMMATLTFAGLRISELLGLRWRHVDLAGGWLTVGDAKTDAGRRRVKVRGALRDELLALRSRRSSIDPAAYVFPTRTGARFGPDNFRNRVLKPAMKRANERLADADLPPLPEKLTPHSLRRTFCSLLYALGEDPGTVMDEMGHTDPALALRVYRQAMRRGDHETTQLRALVEGADWANTGQPGVQAPADAAAEMSETPHLQA